MLRSSKDWLAGRTKSETAGLIKNDVETSYNRLVVQERAKWESEQGALTRTAPGQPTYMVATLVVLLRSGTALPEVSSTSDLREAISTLAAEVSLAHRLRAHPPPSYPFFYAASPPRGPPWPARWQVSVEDNLLGAELLWTPEDTNDVMDRDDMFLNFPELVTI